MKEKRNLIIVNLITLIRVIGAFFLIPIYLNFGFFGLGIAVLIFVSTDSIDGFLARTLKVSTFFGAIFDAVSDKLFNVIVLSILITKIPIMALSLIFEIGILIISFHGAFKGNNAKTSTLGKIKMVIISISIVAMIFLLDYSKLIELFNFPNIDNMLIVNILSIIIVIIDCINFIDYLRLDIIKTSKNTKVKKTVFDQDHINMKEFLEIIFSPKTYEENKNVPIEKLFLKNKK